MSDIDRTEKAVDAAIKAYQAGVRTALHNVR